MKLYEDFLVKLEDLREKKGLTQEEFGKCIGYSKSEYGKMERGQVGITVETLILICVKFNITACDLIPQELLRGKENFTQKAMALEVLTGVRNALVETIMALSDIIDALKRK